MATSTLLPPVAEVPANPSCPYCHGSGIDPTFECACVCTARVGRTAFEAATRDQLGDDGRERQARPNSTGGGKSTGGNRNGATERQIAFLSQLISERDATIPVVARAIKSLGHGITKTAASEYIEALRNDVPRKAAAPAAPAALPQTALCTECRGVVHRGEGTARRGSDGSLLVRHNVCPVKVDLRPLQKFTSKGIIRFGVPGVDTRLKVQIQFNKNGVIYVTDGAEYGQRTDYGQQHGDTYRGKIEQQLLAILADPKAAAIKYTELVGRCACCNRKLEAGESVERGLGPVCWGRLSS